MIVDAACAYLLLGVLECENAVLCLLIYNSFAFVLQVPFGYLTDKLLKPKLAAIFGLCLIALSFLFWNTFYTPIFLASIGNALFHVGGSSLVLSIKKKRATLSSIFVAPGGIGLAIGTFLSVSYLEVNNLVFPLLLMLISFILYHIKTPTYNREANGKSISNNSLLIISLIMIPIAVRSLIGLSSEFPWKENQLLLLFFIASIALGKVVGGIMVERYGLAKVGVGGFLVSAPLLAFYSSVPFVGILGVFIFNFTMPVTLIAILNHMPDKKGFAFGLTTAALFIGSIPIILSKTSWLKNDWMVFSILLLASLILLSALKFKDIFKTVKG